MCYIYRLMRWLPSFPFDNNIVGNISDNAIQQYSYFKNVYFWGTKRVEDTWEGVSINNRV